MYRIMIVEDDEVIARAVLNFPDSNLFLAATAITMAAFAVIYLIVYALTARAYYKIVE